jgi:AP-1 complex subunit sigma 1/2
VQFPRIQRLAHGPHGGASICTPLTDTSSSPLPDSKIVYRRYASLFFIAGCNSDDNELITLEIVHRYVEQMDKYYGNVCELDIIFNFQKAYFILDELLLAGEMQESSKKNVLRVISAQDQIEDTEVSGAQR